MILRPRAWALVAAGLAAAACSRAEPSPLSAGSATVFDATQDAFSLPVPNLAAERRTAFFLGNSFFNQNWVSAPSTVETRDGLGPLFNARSCSGCHFKDGRGRPPEPGKPPVSVIVRISLAADGGAHPVYGDQFQTEALPGSAPEVALTLAYDEQPGHFPDGERYSLRKPRLQVRGPGYGPLPEDLRTSLRAAPALIGVGLLENVSEQDILSRVDERDQNRDGISGRANRVWDEERKTLALGRFGWKAEQPSVKQQVASAFSADMGLTTDLVTHDSCTAAQTACAQQPNGGTPEVSARIFGDVVQYSRTLAVPARRSLGDPRVRQGAELFGTLGCEQCHVATLRTGKAPGPPELSDQEIHPYTDLLLHDMGEGLADQRPVFAASGQEWRTPPLWGLGLVEKVNGHREFLHDGRARGVQEAVLWHAGEAVAAKRAFMALSRAQRAAVCAFVESL
ncbi:MAG TPA: di-heme oxidoredictase family protein [Polyangiales bacterium]|nr:di-heme oxidoredictase family protein [Polyangiales bacterium]